MNMCDIKKSIYSAIVFFGTLIALSVGYGALFGGLTDADKVGSGSWLTATSWNRIIDGVLDIDTRLSNLSFSGGNVGIGTTSPDYLLNIRADQTAGTTLATASSQLSIGGKTTVGKRLDIGYDTNGNGYGFIEAGNYGITWTNLVLQPNGGNVGIGTKSPGTTLELKSSDGNGIQLTNGGSSNKRWAFVGSGNDFRVNEVGVSAVATFQAGGKVGIGTTDPSQRLDLGGGVIGDGVIGGGIKIGGGGIGSSGSCILSAYSDQSSCPAGWTRLAPGLCAKCQ